MRYSVFDKYSALSGTTLLELLFGVAISAIVITGAYSAFGWVKETQRSITISSELERLRRTIQISLDCRITVNKIPKDCLDGTPIDLYLSEKNKLIAAPVGATYTKLGDFNLRASCRAREKIFRIEYSEVKNNGCKSTSGSQCWSDLFDIPVGCP